MDCIVYGVAKSWTQLSDFHFHFSIKLREGGKKKVKILQFCLHGKLELCASTLSLFIPTQPPSQAIPPTPPIADAVGVHPASLFQAGKAPTGVLTTHGSHLLPALPHLPQPDRSSLSSLELHPSQATATDLTIMKFKKLPPLQPQGGLNLVLQSVL